MPVGALNEGIQKLARDSVDALVPLIMQRVYADGAWLPTLTTAGGSVTHVTRRGTFTRVGGQVWFHAQIALSAVSSPTGDVTITGLPLVSAQRGGAWLVNMAGVTLSAGYSMLSGEIAAGTSTIKLRQQGSAVAALTLPGTALSATTTIEIAGMYYASDVPAISLEASILSFGPIAYWKLDEVSGTVATDASGNARHGAYANSPTLGGTFGPFVAPTFAAATTQHVNIYSASLAGAYNDATGTMLLFVRASGANPALRNAIRLATTTNNYTARLARNDASSLARRDDSSGTTQRIGNATTTDSWGMLAMTWDSGANVIELFVNGVSQGTEVPAAAWADTLATAGCVISGQATTGTVLRWQGQIAHVALFSTVLSAANIAAIYAASGL